MSQIIILFTIYSFIGWGFETALKSIRDKKFVNSGFLFGPFCPIYGVGALSIIALSEQMSKLPGLMNSLPIKILMAIVVTTVIEYITAVILENVFHSKWWDYSNEAFNIHGRVCLRFTIIWGMLGYLLINYLHSEMMIGLQSVTMTVQQSFALLMTSYFLLDFTVTTIGLLNQKDYRSLVHERLIKSFPKLADYEIKQVMATIREKIR
ncbi:putative ABC transporter permease [Acidaminobacter sp. JC074]|uniref:putative ABC transporter permease n=1 Tax=Acidaminobacter sp. JC074 TaxID=2530199 RepID=UPI001F0D05EB|nr:putative ABC transporter permease [Acidaminobacter sp. JC074]